MGDVQTRVQRQGGRWAYRVACGLLGAALAMASTVALDAAGTSKALAGEPGKQPLPGHQSQVPPGATLIGPAPAETTLPLVVTLRPRDAAALAAEVGAVSDPHSPEYRHFLTPAQFAQRFGATPGTIAHVTAALRREGLTVGTPSSTGLSLPVSGTVAQIESAFSTPIERYHLTSGKTGYDNKSAPQVPVTIAPQIQGILGLNTLSPPKPSTSVPQASPAGPHGGSFAAAPAASLWQPSPQPGTCATNIGSVQKGGALDAVQLAQAYSFDPLYSANHYGEGTTVALIELGQAGYVGSDITNFANCYGIVGGGQLTNTSVDGGTNTPGPDTAETELDIETVLSLAPKANIDVYEGAGSMYDVFSRIVSDDTAKIVSVSWTNGCEAYVPQVVQSSENSILQAAATEGQSIFVATGDQGSQGCNVNGVTNATTGNDPVAQAVDTSTGTLYIANKTSNSVSVDSEGGTNASNAGTARSVSTGSGPDAVALDSSDHKVFVANANASSLTVFSSSTCNRTTTSGCGSPAQLSSGLHLSSPAALAVNGSTLYVGNSSNGTVTVYNASTNMWVATVNLLSSSVPSALAVDSTNGFVYVADRSNGRIEYFNASTCNATTQTGCGATPTAVSVGNTPVALTVASSAGDLYVANAGSSGGISVVSLSTHAVVNTISTNEGMNGIGKVQSIGMSPDNQEVLAVLVGLGFPGDVMATIDTSSQAISSTVGLENPFGDAMGQLVSDGTLGYVWVTDETSTGDIVQNLNLAVSDPAGQPYITAVGGTSVTGLGPAPTEKVWNDALNYSEGAAGGGISQSFSMPAYQQPLGTVSGSSGTPCANSSGNCREIPDVSADADPSTGYIVYDNYDYSNYGGWVALGGTSGATPLWAAVLAVVASANGNTVGYGALNPALYLLAQKSPSTYLNDITSGNNDYNATNSGQFPAMSGYDMASGLGTPVASQLASGLMGIPLAVAVSGSQTYGGSPTFSGSANYAGSGGPPFDVNVNTSGITCTTVGASTSISPTLAVGSYTLASTSCTGATLSGANAGGLHHRLHERRQRLHGQWRAGHCRRVGLPGVRGEYSELRGNRQSPLGHHREHLRPDLHQGRHHNDDRADPGRRQLHAAALLVQRGDPLGRQRRRVHRRLHERGERLHRGSRPVDHHRLERLHDVRRDGTDDHTGLLRLRQQRLGLVPDDQADVLDHGHDLESGGRKPLRVLLRRRRGSQLHLQLLRRHGHRDFRPADDHRLERVHDLRRDRTDDHAGLLRLQERRHRFVTLNTADLLDDGHELEPGFAPDLPLLVQRGGGCQLRHQLRGGHGLGEQGPADDHGLERVHDLRRDRTDDHAGLFGLRQRRLRRVADHTTDLLDDGHELEPGFAADLPVLVQRCRRPQLRHQLRGGHGDGEQGSADDHGLERHHELRRIGACGRGGVLRVRQRRRTLEPDDTAQLYDHGHELEPGFATDLPVLVQRCRRPQLRHQLRGGHRDGEQGPADHHRVEPQRDLRLDPDHHSWLLGLRQRRHLSVADDPTDLYDDGHELEPGFATDLPVLVQRCRRPQLHHQLRRQAA